MQKQIEEKKKQLEEKEHKALIQMEREN